MPVPYRLGIDIGTNSLGWCALDLDRNGQPKAVRRIGVRIFSDGRDPQSGASLAVDRRMARGARKRRDRFVNRRQDLIKALIRHGLMPADNDARKALENLDPHELRAKGLDAPLPLHHLGRAIFHLNQRRGFKSNRKTDKKQKNDDLKGMKGGIGKLRAAITESGTRTLGEYLFVMFRKGRSVRGSPDGSVKPHATVRARPHVVKNKNEYDLYADRAMYEQEFDLLWRRQSELGAALTDAARDEIRDIIFYQRPLKPVHPGKCALDPSDERAPMALPLFQRFRMLSELANLEIITPDQKHRPLTKPERDKLLAELAVKEKFSFKTMRAKLGLGTEIKFNLESEKRDHLLGDLTGHRLAKKECFGPAWHDLSLDRRNAIVEILLDEPSEAVLTDKAMTDWGLDAEAAANVADVSLPDEHGRLGRKVLAEIVPIMESGVVRYHDAAKQAGYDHARGPDGEVFDQLPYYGEVLQHAVGTGSGEPADPPEKQFGKIANPTVHVALNELRKVVNALAKRYGAPAEIVVEVARDLPLGLEAKQKKNEEQADNQKKNDKRRILLTGLSSQADGKDKDGKIEQQRADLKAVDLPDTGLGLPDTGENRLRLRLWEELGPVHDRRCVYTGKQISVSNLFSPDVEIEHILPFQRTLDNSPANKTVSLRSANRYKGNRSPFEAFHASADGFKWDEILLRATSLPKNKRWRFAEDAMTKYETGERDFLDRQLVDTQYIASVTRDYLTKLSGPYKVWVVTGRLTQMLRGKWGLNSLLSDHNQKNRFDHRHHAIDAFVVGVTDRSMLQRIASAADQNRERLIDDMPDPWDGFRDELGERLRKVVVSHKPNHGVGGKLHEETAYGIVRDPSKEEGATLVYRKALTGLNANEIERIRDKGLREKVKTAVAAVKDDKKKLAEALIAFAAETGIRRVRLTKVEEGFVALNGNDGRPYKAYVPGDNHRIEIFELPSGKWVGVGVTIFDANKALSGRPSPENGRKVLVVHKNDLIRLEHDGRESIMRVVRLRTKAQQLMMAEHFESGNLTDRLKEGSFKWCSVAINQLKPRGARKVTVDHLGRVHDPGPPV